MKDSPVNSLVSSIIEIDRNSSIAIYIQIANHIEKAIQQGILIPGQKIPGARTLAPKLEPIEIRLQRPMKNYTLKVGLK